MRHLNRRAVGTAPPAVRRPLVSVAAGPPRYTDPAPAGATRAFPEADLTFRNDAAKSASVIVLARAGVRSFVCLLLGMLVACAVAGPAGRRLGALEIQDRGDATEVRLEASGRLAYFAYKLEAPPRIMIDLAGARVAGGPRDVLGGRGLVERALLIDGVAPDYVSRLELALRASADVDVRDTGAGLVILVAKPAAPAPAAPKASAPKAAAPPSAALPAATVLSAIAFEPAAGALRVVLTADGALAVKAFRLDARRIVLDLEAVSNGTGRAAIPVEHALLERVRVGEHAGKLRLVLDLRRPAAYALERAGARLVVRLTPS